MGLHRRSGEITNWLKELGSGNRDAENELMDIVYQELRRQAHGFMNKERRNHSLQTTGLVHEAYMRLIDQSRVDWKNRAHFFAISATMMRRILVNYGKNRGRQKRGGADRPITLDDQNAIAPESRDIDLLGLDEALKELAELDERQSRIVELRYFGGLTIEETAEAMELSSATVKRDWRMARAWLKAELTAGD